MFFLPGTPPPSATPLGVAEEPVLAALRRRILDLGRLRLLRFFALSLGASLAEGGGLLVLVPLLRSFGLAGAGDPPPTVLGYVVPPLSLAGVLAVYVLLVLAGALVVRGQRLMAWRLKVDWEDRIRRDLHRALLHMRWPEVQRLRLSDALQVLESALGDSSEMVEMLLSSGTALLSLVVLLAVACGLSWRLTVATLVAGGLAYLVGRRLDQRSLDTGAAGLAADRAQFACVSDNLAGLRVIKVFGAEDRRADVYAGLLGQMWEADRLYIRDLVDHKVALQATAALVAAGVLALAVLGFQVQLASALVAILVFGRLFQAGQRALEARRRLLHDLPSYASAEAYLATAQAAASASAAIAPLAPLQREIRLEGISLAYPGAASPVLVDFSATIPAGGMTAIIGPSGAGKSTLADLLLGLHPPQAGCMRVDGVAVDADHLAAWRRQVACVPQESFLFHDTIRENLRLAHPQATDADLHDALRAAAADFVFDLPAGLDTVVGDRGGRLSGGERQRLALARALLPHPQLLILDEATSNLDADSERRVLETLARLKGHLTLVMVAHRHAVIACADHVITLGVGQGR